LINKLGPDGLFPERGAGAGLKYECASKMPVVAFACETHSMAGLRSQRRANLLVQQP